MHVSKPLAKKSTTNERKEHNAEKYIQWVSMLSLAIPVYLYLFSCCCLPNLQKCICNLVVINSNIERISTVFEILTHFAWKFSPSHPRLMPPSAGTPCVINVFYTLLKTTFNGLQFNRCRYGSVFIHLAVVCSQICEIPQNLERIRTYSWSSSYKVICLGVNWNATSY